MGGCSQATPRPAARRLLAGLLALVVAFCAALQPQPAAAQTPPSLQDIINKIRNADASRRQAEQQRTALTAQLNVVRGRESAATAQLREVESAIYVTMGELARNERRIQEVQLQVYDITSDVAQREEVARQQLESLAGRTRMMYRLSRVSLIEQVLAATSFHEMLQRLSMMQSLAREDKRVVQHVRSEQETLAQRRAQLAEREQELAELKAAIEEQKRQLDVQRQQREAALRAIQAERAQVQAELTETDQQARQYEAEIQRLEAARAAELRRIEEERRRREEEERRRREEAARAAQGNRQAPVYTEPSRVSGAGLIWPTASRLITAYFGERTFAQSFHTGLDTASPIGTPVVAAADGVVGVAGLAVPGNPKGSYGLHVVILHGNGLSTLYAHLDNGRGLTVSAGQSVRQGQVIGYVGMTGITNGPHLHFEVRVNGTPQNPRSYLP